MAGRSTRTVAMRAWRRPGGRVDSVPHAGLLAGHRRGRKERGVAVRRHPGNAADHHVGAAGAGERQGRWRCQHGEEEAGGVFLRLNASDTPVYVTDALIADDIEAYLAQHERKSLLRFITCGSVDDGKSTLIGRLLYDSKMIFEDQLAEREADSKRVGNQGQDIDLALLVDGLAAERERGRGEERRG